MEEETMIELRDKDTGVPIGKISEEQLKFLVDHLEEEFEEDRDYYINPETLDSFEQTGSDLELVRLLRSALGTREDMEIEWSRT
jgi:processive 1,2-diacylglycerol beta-glucosyltransferase